MDVSPRYLLDELFYKIESLPKWNSSVLESVKIQPIDEYTDITYQISTDGGAGLVASRDFVTLRYWTLVNECYVIASTGVEHPSLPKNEKYIRYSHLVVLLSLISPNFFVEERTGWVVGLCNLFLVSKISAISSGYLTRILRDGFQTIF